jgi:hypothetical protein
VGRFVRLSVDAGRSPSDTSVSTLKAAARDITGRDISMDDGDLRRILDARHFVETRVTEGSVNPERVKEHHGRALEKLARHQNWHSETSASIDRAVQALVTLAERMADSAPGEYSQETQASRVETQ